MKLKKHFLKPIATFMAVCMLAGMTSGANTSNTEITVYGVDCPQKEQLIIDMINGGNEEIGISPAGIFCLFGHSLAEATAKQVTHQHWATAPRCRQITHAITYCTRAFCNYSVGTVISDARIHCCP